MTEAIFVGNAPLDGAQNAGWLLGHFLPGDDPRHSAAVEVKWGAHPAGERRAEWVRGERRTTLAVLVSGRFRLEFPGRDALLAAPGDYVLWGVGVDHSWHAEQDSVVLIVRWPSVPGYRVAAEPAVEPVPGPTAEPGPEQPTEQPSEQCLDQVGR